MMEEYEKIHKAGALILDEKKLLLVKPHGKPFLINPGGKYEFDETVEDCLNRELMEELGVEVKSYKHYKTYEIPEAAHNNLPLSLELYVVEIDGEPMPSAEIEKIEWVNRVDFENKRYNLASSFHQYIPDLIKDGML